MEAIRKHRRIAVFGSAALVVSLFALFIVNSFAVPAWQQQRARQQLQTSVSTTLNHDLGLALHPILTVKIFNPDGSLAAERVEKNDLITLNMINFTKEILTPGPSWPTLIMYDTSDVKQTPNVAGEQLFYSTSSTYCTTTFCGAGIEVGTGTNAPARTNVALQTPYMALMPVGNSGYDPATGNVTISASEVATSGATITESGLFLQASTSSGTTKDFLFMRDTFSGVAVSTGQTVSVQYTFELLNTGFTNSFGCLWEQIFSSAPQNGATLSCYVYTTAGSSYGQGLWNSAPNQQYDAAMIYPSNGYPLIEVGTGGGTAQTHSLTKLATSTCSTQGVSSIVQISTSTLKLYATDNCAGSATISEADLLVDMVSATYPYYAANVMLWRTTFSGVGVTGPGTISVTYTIVFN